MRAEKRLLVLSFLTGLIVLGGICQSTVCAEAVIKKEKPLGVTYWDPTKAFNGYTLFAPLSSKDIYLIDMQGRVVHRWELPGHPGAYGKLLKNGNLLYAAQADAKEREEAGLPKTSGQGGIVREVDWDGNIVWEYKDLWQHHDFYRMKNGNTLILKYVEVPFEIMVNVKGGVPGTEEDGKMYTAQIDEVDKKGKVVWTWISYKHLDPEKDVICSLDWRKEWTHANTIVELDDGDILTCFRNIDLVCIIDKKTGSIKWRYGQGPRTVAHMHDAQILPNGNMMIFDNGFNRPIEEINFSRVIEIDPNSKEVKWEYKAPVVTDFYTAACGNAQRLPNGNTLICETLKGRFFEVTKEGEIVWDYTSPFFAPYLFWGNLNWIFKVYRYGPDSPEMQQAKDLDPANYEKLNRLYGPKAFK